MRRANALMPVHTTPVTRVAADARGLTRKDYAPAAAALLLLGTLVFGLSHIALLPPFEGFDEIAHYSSIKQAALTGTLPRHGDPMAREIDDYLAVAPAPAAVHSAWSYAAFFQAPAEIVTDGRKAVHEPASEPDLWRAGGAPNWEAQQPPLYYWLLAPAYWLTAAWSLGARLFVLRALSYGLAVAGLALAVRTAFRHGMENKAPALTALAPALWPLLLPMWFPEMARLGNDSLVILICGGVAPFLARALREGGRTAHFATGIGLGLGLLAKATFLPLTLAALILLALRVRKERRGVGDLATCALCVCLVAGWWYARQALATGSPIGSNDAINLAQNGGLLDGLRQHGSPQAFWRLFGSFAVSVAWAGTWSFIAPAPALLALLVAGWLPLGFGAFCHLRHEPFDLPDSVAPLTLILFLAGLLYHSLILIATVGSGAPAWYLHAFLPVLSPLLGWGLTGTTQFRAARLLLCGQIAYAPLYLLAAYSANLLFFTGCAFNRTVPISSSG